GRLLLKRGDLESSAAHLEEARVKLEALHGLEHPYLATVLTDLARLRLLQGQVAESASLAAQAVDSLEGQVTEDEISLREARLALEEALSAAAAPGKKTGSA
ncbi:MAG: tetratricopeptide repeat protein, partial [Acidobacteriota bacterium]